MLNLLLSIEQYSIDIIHVVNYCQNQNGPMARVELCPNIHCAEVTFSSVSYIYLLLLLY